MLPDLFLSQQLFVLKANEQKIKGKMLLMMGEKA